MTWLSRRISTVVSSAAPSPSVTASTSASASEARYHTRLFKSAASAWESIFRAMYGRKTTSTRGLPTYSFTTTSKGLERVADELKLCGAHFEGPVKNPYPFTDQGFFHRPRWATTIASIVRL